MGLRHDGLIITRDAGAAIAPWRIVKPTANEAEVIQAAAATDALIGATGILGAASGERVDIHMGRIMEVEYGGTVTAGDWLTSDADGKAIATVTADDSTVGRALEDGVDGQIGSVLFSPGKI